MNRNKNSPTRMVAQACQGSYSAARQRLKARQIYRSYGIAEAMP